MLISFYTLLAIIWLHFVADFILQSDRIAKGKSKFNKILLEHVGLYGLVFLVFGWKYALLNAFLHFCVDWCTSRLTSKLWAQGKAHWFFVTIGFDQALHLTCLIITYILLFT